MSRDPVLNRVTGFWGRETKGNNEIEAMNNEKIIMCKINLKKIKVK